MFIVPQHDFRQAKETTVLEGVADGAVELVPSSSSEG